MELDDANIEHFITFVDGIYTQVFIAQYTDFVCIEGYLLDHKQILEMYDLMKQLFPFVHSVIVMTVSSTRSQRGQVDLSSFFDVNVDDPVNKVDNYTLIKQPLPRTIMMLTSRTSKNMK